MPDVQEGLTTSRSVDSDAGFQEALAAQIGRPLEEGQLEHIESQDRDVSAGLTTEESSQPRDEQGRFAPAAPPEPQEEEVAPEEVAVDPAVTEFLSRHGGDPNAALAAALKQHEEAQSFIGRQAGEMGTIREQLARLEGRMEAQPQYVPPPIEVSTEALEDRFAEDGRRAMMWVAENRPDLIDQGIRIWASFSPEEAIDFSQRYYAAQAQPQEPEAPAQAAPQEDPLLAEIKAEHAREKAARQLGESIKAVRGELGEEVWGVVSPHLEKALTEAPSLLQQAVTSEDPQTQREGVALLAERARNMALTAATGQAIQERKSAQRAVKQAAQVATGSMRPVTPASAGNTADMTPEERQQLFRERLMSADTRLVSDGLSFGS